MNSSKNCSKKPSLKSSFFHHIQTINEQNSNNSKNTAVFNSVNSLHKNFIASIPHLLANNSKISIPLFLKEQKNEFNRKSVKKEHNLTTNLSKDTIKTNQIPDKIHAKKSLCESKGNIKLLSSRHSQGKVSPYKMKVKNKNSKDNLNVYSTNVNRNQSKKKIQLNKTLKIQNLLNSPLSIDKQTIKKILGGMTLSIKNKVQELSLTNKLKGKIKNSKSKEHSERLVPGIDFKPIETIMIDPKASFIFSNTSKNKKEWKPWSKTTICTNVSSVHKLSNIQGNMNINDNEERELLNIQNKKLKEIDSCSEYQETDNFIREKNELILYIKTFVQKYKKCPETNLNFYRIGKSLGKGGFGKVVLAIHKLTGKYVAIKVISKDRIKDSITYEKIYREISILKKIGRAHV